jgi:hypothetical protein
MMDLGMRDRMRRFLLRGLALAFLLLGSALIVSETTGAGRRLWYPFYVSVVGARSHEDVVSNLSPRLRPVLEKAARERGLAYPPASVTLVGLKEKRRLEVWAKKGSGGYVLLRDYAILAASGGPGPKLRQGDMQVPEGIYRLTSFNPVSSYHLSIRVDYPNAHDREVARAEHRTNLGGDIYIHGKSVSIGCLAIGDTGIEELYLLLADVGLRNARIILTPSERPRALAGARPWLVSLYERLDRELTYVRGV